MFADARAGIGGGRRVERIDGHREGGAIFVARDVDDVGDDGGRGGARARARALEEEAAAEIALGNDGVPRAANIGESMDDGDEPPLARSKESRAGKQGRMTRIL